MEKEETSNMNGCTLTGSNSVIFAFSGPFLIGVSSLRKEFAPLGENSLRIDSILKGLCTQRN